MKTTTIRKLLTVAVTQAFQQEHLIKTEVDVLVEHILNNSTISVAPDDNIDLKEGNIFGIGETNKDKELEVQKYYVLSFRRTRIVDFQSSWVQSVNMTRSWRFVSMQDFQRIEDYIRSNFDDNTYIAVLIDAVPLDYTVIRNTRVVDDIWTPRCKDVEWGNVYQSGGKPEITERNVSIIWNSPYSWEWENEGCI